MQGQKKPGCQQSISASLVIIAAFTKISGSYVMPSFDVVSEIDLHEVTNAVDQTRRELVNRWDFKNVEADAELVDEKITLTAEQDFQLEQLEEILRIAFSKRGLDARALSEPTESKSGKLVKRTFSLVQGIDQTLAKKIVKMVKDSKSKVQASIQGDKVRMTGKKRDELQEVIQMLRATDLDAPLQFNNFRD
jgi:uncharacterized protein YajQ (UPF0234 family)